MAFFLRAKHWQLFLLFFGIPFVMELFLMFNLFTTIINRQDPVSIAGDMVFFPFIILFFTGSLFGWFWAVATGLQKLMPAGVVMKVTKFKVFFFIPLVYLVCIYELCVYR